MIILDLVCWSLGGGSSGNVDWLCQQLSLEFILLMTWWVFCVTCGGVQKGVCYLEMQLCLSLDWSVFVC